MKKMYRKKLIKFLTINKEAEQNIFFIETIKTIFIYQSCQVGLSPVFIEIFYLFYLFPETSLIL